MVNPAKPPVSTMRPSIRQFLARRRRPLSALWRNTRGSVSIILALSMVTLTTALGIAIDGVRMFTFKNKMQQMADLASIAAASDPSNSTQAALSTVASSYLAANPLQAFEGTVSVEAATYDAATKSFELRLTGTMTTTS